MSVVTTLPRSRAYTEHDLESMPDDGRRYELIDGTLVVTPAPVHAHQRAAHRLSMVLGLACPADLEVLFAPFDVRLAPDTVMQPDLLVARLADLTEKNLPAAPVLAVEIASPSTRLFDLNVKKARFEVAGVQAFWVIDPHVPSLTAWELRDGAYVQVAEATADETFTTSVPFEVSVAPSALVT